MPVTETVHSVWDSIFQIGEGRSWDETWWGHLIVVAIILVVAIIVRLAAHAAIRIFVNRVVTGAKRKQRVEDTQALMSASPVTAARIVQRTRTLGSVLNNVVSVVVVVVAALSIVFTVAPNITGAFSLITAALGAGLGFGAQNIIKDVLTGLFMVGDDQLGVGDIVETDLATGIVEAVGIRVTQIRDVNGTLWYVRNGELTRVGNRSQGWSRAIVDVTLPKGADVDELQQRLLAAAKKALSEPQYRAAVMEAPELWGLESVTADGVVLRLTVRTNANLRDDVAWALRTHLHEAMEDAGVQAAAISSSPLGYYEYAGTLRGVRPPRTSPVPLPHHRRAARPRTPAVDRPAPEAARSGPVVPPRGAPLGGDATTATRGASGTRGTTGRQAPKATDDGADGR